MTVCLNMIVKDEAKVIRRCLDSVRPFIDAWAIVDTGSSDGTQELVRELLADLPGALIERPWRDFGHNRTEALEHARGRADYLLIIDADEVLLPAEGFRLPELTADAYMTVHEAGDSGTRFYLHQLVRSELPWRFEGVLHEVIVCDEPHRVERLEGIVCKGHFDGARNEDPQAKYERDAEVLEGVLEVDPDNARYVFYLAQSYRDAGRLDDAIRTYRRRAAMGGWDEEAWYAAFQVAVLLERQGGDFAPALEAYLAAYQRRPCRAEPLCELARHYRLAGDHVLAHLFAARAHATPLPDDVLFLDASVYAWRSLDELSIAEYWTGRYEASLRHADELLARAELPAAERARVEQNRAFAAERVETGG